MNKLHPVLKPLIKWYTSRVRQYHYQGIKTKILPGVFHPGLFFSTQILLEYLEAEDLVGRKVLELGAGSGLISIFCAIRNATVTSSDISDVSIACIHENVQLNSVNVKVVKSDLFDSLSDCSFDFIIINPPFYPKPVLSDADYAWFCGPDFEYFRKLFRQLDEIMSPGMIVIMILSEDCRIDTIKSLADEAHLNLTVIFEKTVMGEKNFIFKIGRA